MTQHFLNALFCICSQLFNACVSIFKFKKKYFIIIFTTIIILYYLRIDFSIFFCAISSTVFQKRSLKEMETVGKKKSETLTTVLIFICNTNSNCTSKRPNGLCLAPNRKSVSDITMNYSTFFGFFVFVVIFIILLLLLH